MSKLEQRLFFYLLGRWAKRTYPKISSRNGCLCLLPRLGYDVVIKKSTVMRRED